jgi:Ulp1 family protease
MVEQSDIEKLDEGVYLNDNLVQFYLNWLESELQKSAPENAKRIFVFNTFFYTQLTQGPDKGRANHASVARWTLTLDLFSYDYLIVPICEHSHWYFAIICNPQKLLPQQERRISSQDSIKRDRDNVTDELESDPIDIPSSTDQEALSKKENKKFGKRIPDPSQFRIITFDSLNIHRSAACINLKTYLVAELKEKKNIETPLPRSIGLTAKRIPLQENGCDCGLFLSGYIEKFLQIPDEFIRNVMQNTIPVDDDYWPNFRGMRTKIRDLLLDLQAQQIAANDQIRQANKRTNARPRRSR